jgi:hypothetical protein
MKWWIADTAEVIQIINDCDVQGARTLLQRNAEVFLSLIRGCSKLQSTAEKALQIGLMGVDLALEPSAIAENWKLDKGWKEHSEAPGCSWGQFATTI